MLKRLLVLGLFLLPSSAFAQATVELCARATPQGFCQPTGVTASPMATNEAGKGTIGTSQATVATTATSVCPARATRGACTITNTGTTDVYCGATGVTTATGTLLTGTKGANITIPTTAQIFCIVGTGTQAVTVLETY